MKNKKFYIIFITALIIALIVISIKLVNDNKRLSRYEYYSEIENTMILLNLEDTLIDTQNFIDTHSTYDNIDINDFNQLVLKYKKFTDDCSKASKLYNLYKYNNFKSYNSFNVSATTVLNALNGAISYFKLNPNLDENKDYKLFCKYNKALIDYTVKMGLVEYKNGKYQLSEANETELVKDKEYVFNLFNNMFIELNKIE